MELLLLIGLSLAGARLQIAALRYQEHPGLQDRHPRRARSKAALTLDLVGGEAEAVILSTPVIFTHLYVVGNAQVHTI